MKLPFLRSWDDCTHGYDEHQGLHMVQMKKDVLFDDMDCYDNGCAFGGCEKVCQSQDIPLRCYCTSSAFSIYVIAF
jgi:hypothetical protein